MTATYSPEEIEEIRNQIKKGSHSDYQEIITAAPAWWLIKYRFAGLKISRSNPARDREIYAKWLSEIK